MYEFIPGNGHYFNLLTSWLHGTGTIDEGKMLLILNCYFLFF